MTHTTDFSLENYILNHVQNTREWHLPFLPPVHLPGILTLQALMLIIGSGFLILIFCGAYRHRVLVPSGLTNALEAVVLFIRDTIAIPNFGEEEGRKFTPFLCTLFFYILILNLLGLIPIFPAATGNINVTTGLAVIIFVFMTFGAIGKKGIRKFFASFIPQDVPVLLLPLIVPLEILAVFTRTFALTIRLFSNMVAGHMIIPAFLGLTVVIGWFIFPVSLGLAIFISVLEVLVVFLQAYIFTLLSATFIGLAYSDHH